MFTNCLLRGSTVRLLYSLCVIARLQPLPNAETDLKIALDQVCPKSGPWAKFSPSSISLWPTGIYLRKIIAIKLVNT